MKTKIFLFVAFLLVFVVSGLLIKQDNQPINDQQLNNLTNIVDRLFVAPSNQSQDAQAMTNPKASNQPAGESIIAIIYQTSNATWFFKARGLSSLVDQQSAEFSRLFLDQLKFDSNEQPVLEHVPAGYQRPSTQAMRVATYNLNGLEVSVSQLGGKQDIKANILRWRDQLSMDSGAPEFVKYQNENTVLIKLDQISDAGVNAAAATNVAANNSAPTPPRKENLNDFLKMQNLPNWSQLDSAEGMASGELQLTLQDKQYRVAVLRLPSSVPVDTILNIWREKAGVAMDKPLQKTELVSHSQQTWQLIPMNSDHSNLLIAMHQGENRYTFFRLASESEIEPAVKSEFIKLLENIEITQS